MNKPIVALSINSAWNIVNFRKGLIAALQRAGYDVAAIAPPDGYEAQLSALGVDFIPITIDRQGTSAARDLRLVRDYYRVLRRLRPAAYLGYTAKPNIYGSIAAHALGIPVINNIAGLGTAFIKPGLLTRVVAMLYRLALRRSAVVFFQNEDDRCDFLTWKIVREAQARLLPGSGVDLTHFRPQPRQEADSGPVFLLIARLLWDKGIGEYVEAARISRALIPDGRFQILGFLGAANRTAVPRQLVEEWSEGGTIEYLGETNDVRDAIAAADCIVLPSYREGLPRSLLEAAAMRKPLIATDVPGCRQVTRDGVNGFLCAPRDAQSLADCMIRFARLTPAETEEMGLRSRQMVEAEFDERIVTDRYLDALRRIEASRPKGAAPPSRPDPLS